MHYYCRSATPQLREKIRLARSLTVFSFAVPLRVRRAAALSPASLNAHDAIQLDSERFLAKAVEGRDAVAIGGKFVFLFEICTLTLAIIF